MIWSGLGEGFVYPPFPDHIKWLYNQDNLNSSSQDGFRLTGELEKRKIDYRDMYLTGPYLLPDGFHGLFAYYPLFKKAASISTDLGCGREPTNCTDVCYDDENNEKYFGTVGGLKNVDALFDGTHPVYSPLNANN